MIIAGDLTANESLQSWKSFFDWILALNYKKKIVVAGNHDNFCTQWATSSDTIYEFLDKKDPFDYLCDSGTEFKGLKIWGSPWTKMFKGINPLCKAFVVDTEKELEEKWRLIPEDTDILITHSPAYGILDLTACGKRVGSKSLQMEALKLHSLKLWVTGHIHESYGIEWPGGNYPGKIVNVSHVNQNYRPVNKPIRVVL